MGRLATCSRCITRSQPGQNKVLSKSRVWPCHRYWSEQCDFEQCWNDISGALIGLRANQVDIDLLKSSAIGETNYIALLTKWKLEEEQLKETVNNLKEMFCELKAKLQNQNTPKQCQCSTTENLPKCDFSLHTSSLVDQFQEGTRLWVLKEIEDFYTNPKQQSRALVITALPGVGKSVLAAVACRNAREKGRLGACHFVQHNDSQRSNPRIVIESIARHLCDTIEGFKEQLHNQLLSLQSDIRKKLDELNLNALFSVLIEEPLTVMQSSSTEQSRVVFIDALDEIEPSSRKEFITVLLSKLKSLPKGIKYILTSRPLEQLTDLPHVTVVNIDARDSYNTDGIRRNGTKLARLLIDGGTEALRRSFDAIHPPANPQGCSTHEQASVEHSAYEASSQHQPMGQVVPTRGSRPRLQDLWHHPAIRPVA